MITVIYLEPFTSRPPFFDESPEHIPVIGDKVSMNSITYIVKDTVWDPTTKRMLVYLVELIKDE